MGEASLHPGPGGAQEPRQLARPVVIPLGHTWEAQANGWREIYYRAAGERDAYRRALEEANLALRARSGRRPGRRG